MPGARPRLARRRALVALLTLGALAAAGLVAAPGAAARTDRRRGDEPGVQHLHLRYGPVDVQPGQNNIAFSGRDVPKPAEDGFILGIKPNLRTMDGKVPPVDVIHLHHGVWLNFSARDATVPAYPERFFAVGEEKTIMRLPRGYGYPYHASDRWSINYMIHNLYPNPSKVWVTYDLDFLPASAPAAASIKPARPIWMDVVNGSIYPVFDALKGSGTNGTFTFPDQATNPYGNGRPRNEWTVDRDGVLIGTAGHLHPGGLHTDLTLTRPGASASPGSSAARSVRGSTAHLFRSDAHYFEPAGAVSWDVAMTATKPDWRVGVHKGDVLAIHVTYDTRRASWYESMGIMIAWMADGTGAEPFTTRVDKAGVLTHGHLPENDHHGGARSSKYFDATRATSMPATNGVVIQEFLYAGGDLSLKNAPLPTVRPGQSLTFVNRETATAPGIWHTITACQAPCNRSTGIAYPLADANVQFDSGELGVGGPPTSGRLTWQTPSNLAPGTYTYFCRIHPFMRGAFRVAPA